MRSIYIATGYLDGATLAARCAADLPAHGLRLVEGGDWWAWTDRPDDRTVVHREEDAIVQSGRLLVLLTDACGVGTGAEAQFARLHGLPFYWLNCGRTREIPPILRFGTEVSSLDDLARKIRKGAEW